ncbi:extracellular solute-binding protein [Nonomuraea sp. NPDC005650]|uniref:ABC transporter substrate-binding protein n=1 Tax=Nonomuraea sp. NPDC005650 TaxID=3157045 RepID=UPI0033BE7176
MLAVGTVTGCAAGAEENTSSADAVQATDPAQIESLAKTEGEVSWLAAGTQATSDAVAAAFEKRYGISVKVARYSSADMAQRIESDVRGLGRIDADVTTQTDNALALSLRDGGYIERLSAKRFPGFPEKMMYGEIGPLVQFAVPVVGYNTRSLDGFVPDSWDDLLDPRLKGKLMIADPRSAATWGQIWHAILKTPALGEKYVKALVAQDFQPVASSLVGAEQLAAGQGSVLVASTPSVFNAQIAKGAPIAFFSPTNPAPVAYTSVSIVKGAAHPNAAQLFARWLAGEEGSQVLNTAEGTASPLGELKGTFPSPPGIATTPPDPGAVRASGERAAELLGFR